MQFGRKKVELAKLNLSRDSYKPLKSLPNDEAIIRKLYHYIKYFNNIGNIFSLKGEDIQNIDLLTYSFPCTDLSTGGKGRGMSRNSETRSGLLWQIERILLECKKKDLNLPTTLLMENVSTILSDSHVSDFEEWQTALKELGYTNYIVTLKGSNFGIPQSRVRVFMVSTLDKNLSLDTKYLEQVCYDLPHPKEFLKLDYSIQKFRNEADNSALLPTESRLRMWETNRRKIEENKPFNTITTNMDRQNNAGMIRYTTPKDPTIYFRLLTAREAWLLMGVPEESYEKVQKNSNLSYRKMVKLAGNAIIVNVLQSIFENLYLEDNL